MKVTAPLLAAALSLGALQGVHAVSFEDVIESGLGVDLDALGVGSILNGGGVDNLLCPGDGVDLGGFSFPDLSFDIGKCKVGADADLEEVIEDYGPKSEMCRYLPSSTPARMDDEYSLLTGQSGVGVRTGVDTNAFDKNIYSLAERQMKGITKDCSYVDESLPANTIEQDGEVFQSAKMITASQTPDRDTAAVRVNEVRRAATDKCKDSSDLEGCVKSVLGEAIDKPASAKRTAGEKVTASRIAVEQDASMPREAFMVLSEEELKGFTGLDAIAARKLIRRQIAQKTLDYALRNAVATTDQNIFEAQQVQIAAGAVPVLKERLAKAALSVETALKDLP